VSGRIARIDDLERYQISGQDGLTWRPIRRYFDIKAFGVNAYTAEEAGQRVVEEHREEGGHEELYVVVSGRASFMVDGEDHDAPAGTLVHCPPGTLRGAVAAEPRTTVLGIGAKPGEVFQPSGWEWVFAGVSLLDQGDEEGRAARDPGRDRCQPGRLAGPVQPGLRGGPPREPRRGTRAARARRGARPRSGGEVRARGRGLRGPEGRRPIPRDRRDMIQRVDRSFQTDARAKPTRPETASQATP
jgi:hypothetical protein